jgi:hypothetical protein
MAWDEPQDLLDVLYAADKALESGELCSLQRLSEVVEAAMVQRGMTPRGREFGGIPTGVRSCRP